MRKTTKAETSKLAALRVAKSKLFSLYNAGKISLEELKFKSAFIQGQIISIKKLEL